MDALLRAILLGAKWAGQALSFADRRHESANLGIEIMAALIRFRRHEVVAEL